VLSCRCLSTLAVLARTVVVALLVWTAPEPAEALVGWPGRASVGDARAAVSHVHRARVVCRETISGNQKTVFYCRTGYVCAPNGRCSAGPELRRQKERELAEQARERAASARQRAEQRLNEERRALGPERGGPRWNDPRVVPTPRYGRPRPPQSAPVRNTFVAVPRPAAQRLTRAQIAIGIQRQIIALAAAARTAQANDPNREVVLSMMRNVIREHKIPITVDELLEECTEPSTTQTGSTRSYPLRWRPQDIPDEIEARNLCDHARNDPSELQSCRAFQFGQVVMAVEPTLRAICSMQEAPQRQENLAALGACAERRFRNAWLVGNGSVSIATSGTIADGGKQCDAVQARRSSPLRDRLRKALAQAGMADEADSEPEPASAATTTPTPDPAPSARTLSDADEIFCAYIARRSVRGELRTGGGAPIPAYCRAAMDEAKSCTDQTCTMADVIAEHEKRNAPELPWGAADREEIDTLLKSIE
jgi:hypothetical protein